MTKKIIVLSLLVSFFVSMAFSMGVETVKELDIERYQGTWYEIGRFGLFFENGLSNVTAEYAPLGNGKISVVNTGYYGGPGGLKSSVNGSAYVPNPEEPAKLLVKFFASFESDYWVVELDQENYSYAVVTTPTMGYLWILSRTPKMDEELYTTIVKTLEAKGYPVEKIQKVEQNW